MFENSTAGTLASALSHLLHQREKLARRLESTCVCSAGPVDRLGANLNSAVAIRMSKPLLEPGILYITHSLRAFRVNEPLLRPRRIAAAEAHDHDHDHDHGENELTIYNPREPKMHQYKRSCCTLPLGCTMGAMGCLYFCCRCCPCSSCRRIMRKPVSTCAATRGAKRPLAGGNLRHPAIGPPSRLCAFPAVPVLAGPFSYGLRLARLLCSCISVRPVCGAPAMCCDVSYYFRPGSTSGAMECIHRTQLDDRAAVAALYCMFHGSRPVVEDMGSYLPPVPNALLTSNDGDLMTSKVGWSVRPSSVCLPLLTSLPSPFPTCPCPTPIRHRLAY